MLQSALLSKVILGYVTEIMGHSEEKTPLLLLGRNVSETFGLEHSLQDRISLGSQGLQSVLVSFIGYILMHSCLSFIRVSQLCGVPCLVDCPITLLRRSRDTANVFAGNSNREQCFNKAPRI